MVGSWLVVLPCLMWQFPPKRSMFHISKLTPNRIYIVCLNALHWNSHSPIVHNKMTNKNNTPNDCPCRTRYKLPKYAPGHESTGTSGSTVLLTFNLSTWKLMVSSVPWPHYSQDKNSRYRMDTKISEPQSWCRPCNSLCLSAI